MRSRNTKSTNLSALKLIHDRGELVIPAVQRDAVWVLSQKQLLIDSLFRDYDIPKIYLRDVERNGQIQYEVIDGQQRLNAIIGFYNDEFAMPNDSDDAFGEKIAKKKWSELSSNTQIEFNNIALDVVHLVGYSDEETDEMFLRLQNGTPLKAAEKRRAIPGTMRDVVRELSEHEVFTDLCDFDNSHYAYEDVSAKALKQIIEGGPASISAQQLAKMFIDNPSIKITDKAPADTQKAFNFIRTAFANTANPRLKKYAIMDLTAITSSMLKAYNLRSYATEFAEAYLSFDTERLEDKEKPEEEQSPKFLAYSNCTRADSLDAIEFRQNMLKEYILAKMDNLVAKDNNRYFTPDQRTIIYRRGNGICAICGNPVSEDEFEADHIIPHCEGGETKISNGQVLCESCNRHKSGSLADTQN